MRFGYTARNGSSGKIQVCTINARITNRKLAMIRFILLFIDLRPRIL